MVFDGGGGLALRVGAGPLLDGVKAGAAAAGLVSASSNPFRFFHPERPSASRRSLRCHEAFVIG